jgi:hypothetical protein
MQEKTCSQKIFSESSVKLLFCNFNVVDDLRLNSATWVNYSQSTLKSSCLYLGGRHFVSKLPCSEVSRRQAVSGTLAQTKGAVQRTVFKVVSL